MVFEVVLRTGAVAWAWAKPKPWWTKAQGSGLKFGKPRPSKAEPKPQLSGQAGPAHHYTWGTVKNSIALFQHVQQFWPQRLWWRQLGIWSYKSEAFFPKVPLSFFMWLPSPPPNTKTPPLKFLYFCFWIMSKIIKKWNANTWPPVTLPNTLCHRLFRTSTSHLLLSLYLLLPSSLCPSSSYLWCACVHSFCSTQSLSKVLLDPCTESLMARTPGSMWRKEK